MALLDAVVPLRTPSGRTSLKAERGFQNPESVEALSVKESVMVAEPEVPVVVAVNFGGVESIPKSGEKD